MAVELTVETFRSHEGEVFVVHPGTPGLTTMELTLAEVTEFEAGRPVDDDRRAPFSLLFRGPVAPVLPSGTHKISHPQIGEHLVFMGPVQAAIGGKPQAPGICYEVVFN